MRAGGEEGRLVGEKADEKENSEMKRRRVCLRYDVCPDWSVVSCWSKLCRRQNMALSRKSGKFMLKPP
jgi:hypothetical protein